MILKRVQVKNFRSCRDATVETGNQLAIVGGNGTGKSTILRAIDRFYGQSTIVDIDDFFGKRVGEPIEISLTFTEFNEVEHDMFASRIHNGEMTVARVFDAEGGRNSGKYYGVTRQHTPFSDIRSGVNATAQRTAYGALRDRGGIYASLPSISAANQIAGALADWEAANLDECDLGRDDGQFFGFTNVARGALQRATSFVFIPAVRDAAADAIDGSRSVVGRLMELVVRNAIQQRTEIREFQTRISKEYKELTDPARLHELGGLSGNLTETLQLFYKEAAVALQWKPAEDFTVPLPTADVLLNDDGFEGPVDRKGHGLQRAFILTLLQHLAQATSAAVEAQDNEEVAVEEALMEASEEIDGLATEESVEEDSEESAAPYTLPGLILAIEEPELYQHPTKQRHFANVLSDLSSGQLAGVARQMQVLFATHSSLFVSMDRFEEVRLARRRAVDGDAYKECELKSCTLAEVATALEQAYTKPEGTFSAEGLKPRLHIINSEIAEGFFADAVVLVEGVSDRAAIVAGAAMYANELQELGIAVLAVDGKSKLDRPTAIFTRLHVPTYVVWDCDKRGEQVEGIEHNRALQRLTGLPPEEIVDAHTKISERYACFENKLETVLKQEIGADVYEACIQQVKERFGIDRNDDVEKAPFAMSALLNEAALKGRHSATLRSLVKSIVAMRQPAQIDQQAAEVAPT